MTTNHRALDTLPLSEFRSLDYVLADVDMVVLYFAAAWCPQSTITTQEPFFNITMRPKGKHRTTQDY